MIFHTLPQNSFAIGSTMPKILLSSCLLLLLQAQLCHWVCIHIFENISGLIVQSFFQHVPMIVPHLCANEIHASCCKDRVWVFSLLSVSAVLAAIHLQIAIIFLGWSLLKMTCPFARTYLTQSTMTPRHGSLICADKSMLSVIIIPMSAAVHILGAPVSCHVPHLTTAQIADPFGMTVCVW
jgi:hypothetical protein